MIIIIIYPFYNWDISCNFWKIPIVLYTTHTQIHTNYCIQCVQYIPTLHEIAEPKQSYNDIAGVKYVVWDFLCIIIVIAAAEY